MLRLCVDVFGVAGACLHKSCWLILVEAARLTFVLMSQVVRTGARNLRRELLQVDGRLQYYPTGGQLERPRQVHQSREQEFEGQLTR